MDRQQPPQQAPTTERAGHSIEEWVQSVGISRPTFYLLDDACQPESVMVGTRRIIRESGAKWLARMAAIGGAKLKRKVAA